MLVLSTPYPVFGRKERCLFCGVAYLQRGPAGLGRCDDCFWRQYNSDLADAKQWWTANRNLGAGI